MLDILPSEIIAQIYLAVPTVSSALNLSATCHRLYSAFHTSKRLTVLTQAAELEFGPLDDIVQLVTQNTTQPAHIHRNAAISDALIGQIVHVGRIAQRWEEIYPLRKWKTDFANRRLLTTTERQTLRRALYRLWLFSRAYHNSAHIRSARLLPAIMRERAALLHNFNTAELAEMLDAHLILRDVVANNICPSNGKMRAKFHKRFPEYPASQISIHLNYNLPPSAGSTYNSKFHAGVQSSLYPDASIDGWGDDIGHYYVVEDMMKLDPKQILHLRDQGLGKRHVEAFVAGLGEWFSNNGEVFSETLAFVIGQRGGDMQELKDAVVDGEIGIVL